MTAIISLVQSDAVHFLTDGSGVADDQVLFPMQKAIAITHLGVLVAIRGPAALLYAASAHLSALRSFDEMCAKAPDCLRIAERLATPAAKASSAGSDFDCYIAGKRVGIGWRAYVVTNHARYDFGPFTLQEMPNLSYAPADGPASQVVAHIAAAGLGPDDFDPATHGLQIMLAQRRHGGSKSAGGFCQLTSATDGGVTSRIIRNWSADFVRSYK